MPLAGRPMIWHIAQRCMQCKHVDQVIIATSTESSDDKLYDYCLRTGLNCFRGSLNNVLSRYSTLINIYPHKYLVRITGDCPLIDPNFIDFQIEALNSYDADLVNLCSPSSVLDGQGVYSSRLLNLITRNAHESVDLEHVGSLYINSNLHLLRVVNVTLPDTYLDCRYRITVDERSDYTLMSTIYNKLYNKKPIPLASAIKYLQLNPSIASVNNKACHSEINQKVSSMRQQSKFKPVATVNFRLNP